MNLIVRGSEVSEHRDVMKQLFRIRYENFVVRRNWSMPSRDRMDIDQYDNEDAIYFMSVDAENDILCSARITHTVNNSLLADLFPYLIETGEPPRGEDIFEGTRFTLSPKLQDRAAIRHVRADLGAEIVRWIRRQGGTQLQAVVEWKAFSQFTSMSLLTRPLGLPRDYGGGSKVEGGGRCIAFRWPLTDELLSDFEEYSRGSTPDEADDARLAAVHWRRSDMMRQVRPITPDEVATFNMAGVVLLRGVLDLRTVNSLRRHIDDATQTLHESPAGYDLSALTKAAEGRDVSTLASNSAGQYNVAAIADYVRATGEPMLVDDRSEATGSFLLDTGVSSRISALKQLCLKGVIPEIASALLRSEEVTFLGDQIFVKEPQTAEKTAYHQDAAYFEIEGEQCCVMWIPVDPVTQKNGGMRYVRGSHRGKLHAPNLFVTKARMPGSEGDLLPDIENNPDDYDIVHFDVEPGDIVVHHFKTIHGAGGNLSRYQVRRAASIRYCGDDIRWKTKPGVPPQLHHTTRLNDGDRLHGPDFPTVWRRKREAAVA